MVSCGRRHRHWQSWEDAEAFYRRAGPYSKNKDTHSPVDESSSPYALHEEEVRIATEMFNAVSAPKEVDLNVFDRDALLAHYDKGAKMALRLGFQPGTCLGKRGLGILEPVPARLSGIVYNGAHHVPFIGHAEEEPRSP